jgi:hypothetical protein
MPPLEIQEATPMADRARKITFKDQVVARWARLGKPPAFVLRSKLAGAQKDYAVVLRRSDRDGCGPVDPALIVYTQEGKRRLRVAV